MEKHISIYPWTPKKMRYNRATGQKWEVKSLQEDMVSIVKISTSDSHFDFNLLGKVRDSEVKV